MEVWDVGFPNILVPFAAPIDKAMRDKHPRAPTQLTSKSEHPSYSCCRSVSQFLQSDVYACQLNQLYVLVVFIDALIFEENSTPKFR